MTAYRDRDGDVWTRNEHGQYVSPGLNTRALDELRDAYGPLTPLTDDTEEAPRMTREEALAKATEHVNSLSTNSRGYQDGVRFPDKVAAVERLARFLAGDAATDEEA
ncbi:hypothetical protein OHB41_03690 [Streptomyces sp. NBC_01571]|uniref:hypothetical protein n=1 Tax=Streptomyces sp. NBC_01571 TaxID=2975883 RepID=UPI002256D047|nr:hypothetical protein [Streptomyces sp. NBC_01571]MCX4572301.1 hypothetical protein [Streptomyces sp. NBC_01571]